jgi:hypothetical protein
MCPLDIAAAVLARTPVRLGVTARVNAGTVATKRQAFCYSAGSQEGSQIQAGKFRSDGNPKLAEVRWSKQWNSPQMLQIQFVGKPTAKRKDCGGGFETANTCGGGAQIQSSRKMKNGNAHWSVGWRSGKVRHRAARTAGDFWAKNAGSAGSEPRSK